MTTAKQHLLILIIGFQFAATSSGADEARKPSQLSVFEEVCINNLFDIEKQSQFLTELGWTKQTDLEPAHHDLIKNVITSGFAPDSEALFISPGETDLMMFGRRDNDVYAVYDCFFSSENDDEVDQFISKFDALFSPIASEVIEGSAYKNLLYTWEGPDLVSNVSKELHLNNAMIHHFKNGVPLTTARFNARVSGFDQD